MIDLWGVGHGRPRRACGRAGVRASMDNININKQHHALPPPPILPVQTSLGVGTGIEMTTSSAAAATAAYVRTGWFGAEWLLSVVVVGGIEAVLGGSVVGLMLVLSPLLPPFHHFPLCITNTSPIDFFFFFFFFFIFPYSLPFLFFYSSLS